MVVKLPNIRKCIGVGGLKEPQAINAIRGNNLLPVSSIIELISLQQRYTIINVF